MQMHRGIARVVSENAVIFVPGVLPESCGVVKDVVWRHVGGSLQNGILFLCNPFLHCIRVGVCD